ncbi:hypothetical protein CDL12_00644 [Handroanthus impetiginosus]|uniref:Mediator complex subunit 15 KIX domain-containing protein n=1 Tax=Handroanthus impetiginosus TaxID=429701 RepID=A0A2G9IA34_9LAMI|nr:hypothetical protein CDL12_00644 [Handroanthus impetiginosus]
MEGGDWRTQLHPDSRRRIVNKIMETLKRHLPFSGQDGLRELKKIAVRFEDKIYTAATSQSDYLRKISLKMLTMETKSQNPMANSIQSNAPSNRKNPQDSGMEGSDWRSQLHPASRQRIVIKILETLKGHLPFSGQEGLQELKKRAVGIEEKIYTAATSQSDYIRRISLHLLTMNAKPKI